MRTGEKKCHYCHDSACSDGKFSSEMVRREDRITNAGICAAYYKSASVTTIVLSNLRASVCERTRRVVVYKSQLWRAEGVGLAAKVKTLVVLGCVALLGTMNRVKKAT